MDVSIIIVTKNEAATIGRCIESVLADTQGMTIEIVVVDSRSDDGTVEIAKSYPVTLAQLKSDSLITSHAGRYVGTLLSRGTFLCYLDGDMILIPGWIPKAVDILRKGEVQAVGGRLFRVRPGEPLSFEHSDNYDLGFVDRFGGAGVYVGDLLRSVGPFNPFMRGEGERELGFRLRQYGARMLRVDIPMVYHIDKPRTAAEVDEKAGMFAGIGQLIRRYPARQITASLLGYHKFVLLEIGVLWLFMVLPVVLLVAGLPIPASLSAGLALVLFAALVFWKGLKKTMLYLRSRFMNSFHIVRGLHLGLRDASEYVPSFDIIRTSS